MDIKGQAHSLILVQGHSDSTFLNFFSLETAKPIEAKFYVKLQLDRMNKELFQLSRSHDQCGRHAHLW